MHALLAKQNVFKLWKNDQLHWLGKILDLKCDSCIYFRAVDQR